MRHRSTIGLCAAIAAAAFVGCAKKGTEMQWAPDVEARRAQFMRYELNANLEHLSPATAPP
jgi:hypothetical protein